MSTTEITSKIENIKTLQTMIDELTVEMESVKDEVKISEQCGLVRLVK